MAKKGEQLNNRIEFEKVRQKRRRAQLIKRLVILGAVILVAVIAVSVVGSVMQSDLNIRVGDFVEGLGGSGYPVAVPGGVISDVKSLGQNLAVLNDNNLYVYTQGGKNVGNFQHASEATLLVTNEDRALLYQDGGKRYSLHSSSKTLLERENANNIYAADLNASGDYALVTSSSQAVSQVVVYNKRFESIFEWLSFENLVVDVSLSSKDRRMVAGCVNSRGGHLYSIVSLFDFGVAEELTKIELDDELVLSLAYLEDGRFAVLTDKALRIYTAGAAEDSRYTFGSYEIRAVERNGRETLLLLEDGISRNQRLVRLDANCAELAAMNFAQPVRDVAFADGKIYVLSETGITTYSSEFELLDVFEQRGISNIHCLRGKLYYLDAQDIRVLSAGEQGRQ